MVQFWATQQSQHTVLTMLYSGAVIPGIKLYLAEEDLPTVVLIQYLPGRHTPGTTVPVFFRINHI